MMSKKLPRENKTKKQIMLCLGIVIKKARIGARITQKCLAEKVGIRPAYLSQIETGKRSPSYKLLDKLAFEFGTRASQFMFEAEFLNSGNSDHRVSLLCLLVKSVEQAPDTGRFIGSISDAEALVRAMKNMKVM